MLVDALTVEFVETVEFVPGLVLVEVLEVLGVVGVDELVVVVLGLEVVLVAEPTVTEFPVLVAPATLVVPVPWTPVCCPRY